MKRGGTVSAGAIALLALWAAAEAQTPPAPAETQPDFSVDVNLVSLRATVRNSRGEFVSGLTRDDFRVFQDGQPQTIRYFGHNDVPVAVGLVVDESGSMGPKKADVVAGALAFARCSNPQDEVFVVNFNEHVTLGLPGTELFSARFPELEKAIMDARATGRTALYDAVDTALAYVGKAAPEKKVLIVISDGGDNASRRTLADVAAAASRSNVIIYAIGLFGDDDSDSNPAALRRLSKETGGMAYFPATTSAVAALCEKIAREIRNQYTIGYTPSTPAQPGTFHRISVEAHGRNGKKLQVRTRTGYTTQ